MTKAILFGLWETLGSKGFSASRTLREHFTIANSPDFLAKYEQSMQLQEWDAVQAMAQNFLHAFSIQPIEKHINYVCNTIQQGIDQAELFDGMEAVLQKLRVKYKLAVLSNTNNFESQVTKKWNIQQYFAKELYSWQTGYLKPGKESFENACAILNVTPDECIFVDNEDRSVAAAQEIEFQVIKFASTAKLLDDLTTIKVL